MKPNIDDFYAIEVKIITFMTSQAQYLVADRHYRKLVLPSCIDAMRHFVDLEQRKREMADEADRFRRYVDLLPLST